MDEGSNTVTIQNRRDKLRWKVHLKRTRSASGAYKEIRNNIKQKTNPVIKCWGIDQAVTPMFLYLLNKVSDPSLHYFHYFFLMFHYCSCLISVPVCCKTTLICLLFCCYARHWLLPLYGQLLPFQWNKGTKESFITTLTV